MKQEYFVVVLAHSLHGRLRRIHIPHQAVYAILAFALLGCISAFGFVASYARMAWKVANYNALRRETDTVRARYRTLEKKVNETDKQLATLENLAREISMAYGIKEKLEGPASISSEGALVPSFPESLQDYQFLRSASLISLRNRAARRLQPVQATPNGWPVDGRLMDGYGARVNPFAGEGEREIHKGVDISAPTGTPVKATANGIVTTAEPTSGGYGRLIVIDHGGGVQTCYAHLSRLSVQTGREVRRGEVIGAVGSTGRVTAPHLHYEIRLGGTAVNPYNYMRSGPLTAATHKDFPF
jgi:murein DD-endopeptidase MepM/ murein hydrolase activator NlpD